MLLAASPGGGAVVVADELRCRPAAARDGEAAAPAIAAARRHAMRFICLVSVSSS